MTGVDSLNHVALNFTDLDAALRFFTEGLGLRKTLEKRVGAATWEMLGMAEETGGMSVFVQGSQRVGQIELVQWDKPPAQESRVQPGQVGHVVMSFPIPSDQIAGLHKRLTDMGYPCTELKQAVIPSYGPISVFVTTGPDDYQAEIISLPTRDEVKAFRAAAAAEG